MGGEAGGWSWPAANAGCCRFLAPAGGYFRGGRPEGAPQEHLTELARGARWVKVIAGFPPMVDGMPSGPPGLTYHTEAVETMVAAVHAAGGRVAAHVTSDVVSQLVRAGVDSIEHGTALGESPLRFMAQTGAARYPPPSPVCTLPETRP